MLRYIGYPGQFIVGVPARDMAEDEAARYGGVDALLASKFYVKSDALVGDPIEPIEDVVMSGIINLADGVDDAEAQLAGRTLRKRRVKHGTN